MTPPRSAPPRPYSPMTSEVPRAPFLDRYAARRQDGDAPHQEHQDRDDDQEHHDQEPHDQEPHDQEPHDQERVRPVRKRLFARCALYVGDDDKCPVCLEQTPLIPACVDGRHGACRKCLVEWWSTRCPICPLCRNPSLGI